MQNSTSETGREADDAGELDLKRYFELIRKRKWVLLACLAVGITMAVLYTMRQTRVYEATASVVVDPQPPQVFGSQVQEVVQLGAGSYWSNQEYYNTQIDILESFDLAKVTVSRSGLFNRLVPRVEGIDLSEEKRIEQAASLLNSMLHATQSRGRARARGC